MPERISPKPHAGGNTDRPASKFLDTRGNPSLGIGICQRCQFKFPLHMLQTDPNIPGFMVCAADRDDFDPYRMAPRSADKLTLPYVRPDVPMNQPAVQPDWLTPNDPVEPFPNDQPGGNTKAH
jgi:hypothetical protein